MDGGKPMRFSYTNNYRSTTGQLRNAESWRTSIPQVSTYQLVFQYQILSPDNNYFQVCSIGTSEVP